MASLRDSAAPGTRGSWLTSFVLLMVVMGSWAFASPLFSSPDEPSHVVKGAAVARLQFLGRQVVQLRGGPGREVVDEPIATLVDVPLVFTQAHEVPTCYAFRSERTAECAAAFSGQKRSGEVATYAGRNPPLYYFLVGLPTLAFPSATGVYLMRLVSAALSAAFLASAFASAREWRGPRLLVLGTALAVSPMVLFLASTVNPNSLEVSAALCCWVSGLVLVERRNSPGDGRLLARTGVAASVLVLARALSLLWLVIIGAVLIGLMSRADLKVLVRRRDAKWWLGGVVAASVLAVAWVVGANALDMGRPLQVADYTVVESLRLSLGATGGLVRQMIGVFGWLDAPSPLLTYILWLFAVGFVIVLGLATGSLRTVAVIVSVVALTILVPAVVDARGARAGYGFIWQGRYTLPLAVGVPVLSAYAASKGLAGGRSQVGGIARVLAVMIFLAQVFAYVWAFRRYTVGLDGGLNILDGRWRPPLPVAALLGTFVLSQLCFGWWMCRLVSVGCSGGDHSAAGDGGGRQRSLPGRRGGSERLAGAL